MIDKALTYIPVHHRMEALLWVLIIAGFALGFVANGFRRATVVNRQIEVPAKVGSGSQVAEALGKPDQVVDGSTISPSLQGLACAVFRSKQAIVCYPTGPSS